jgi:alkylhydroperoxidase family enzyme
MIAAVLEDWKTAPINEKLKATLGFLEKLTLSPEEVKKADVDALRSLGISDKAIEDAIYVCFLFNIIDRIADAFNFPLTPQKDLKWVSKLLLKAGYKASSVPSWF